MAAFGLDADREKNGYVGHYGFDVLEHRNRLVGVFNEVPEIGSYFDEVRVERLHRFGFLQDRFARFTDERHGNHGLRRAENGFARSNGACGERTNIAFCSLHARECGAQAKRESSCCSEFLEIHVVLLWSRKCEKALCAS